jgi:hypothetical protein
MDLNELLDTLIEQDGMTKAYVSIEVEPVVSKRNTGETDEHFQEIRERVASEDEIAALVATTEWSYDGTIDVMGDFYVRDRLRKSYTIESPTDQSKEC